MRTNLNSKYVDKLIERSKKNFLKSNQPDKIKEILNSLNPHILFCENWRITYGMAYTIEYQSIERLIMGLKRNDPRYLVDGKKQHLVIEISNKCQTIEAKQTFDIVSHELTHCLDFILRGYCMNRKKRSGFHDGFWAKLHQDMGGTGNQFFIL